MNFCSNGILKKKIEFNFEPMRTCIYYCKYIYVPGCEIPIFISLERTFISLEQILFRDHEYLFGCFVVCVLL